MMSFRFAKSTFDAFPTDGGAGIPALAVDNPLTGLSLQLDSGFLDALFAEGGTTVGGDGAGRPGDDIGSGFGAGISDARISDDGPEVGISAAGTFEPGARDFFATQVSEDFATGFRTDELPINAISFSAESGPDASGAPGDSGVAFIDLGFSSAKGGVKGGNGGGKGGDGGGDAPKVLSNYVSGTPDTDVKDYYNIEIKFKGGDWTEPLQTAFISESELISDLITEGATDIFFRGKIIDDIRIDAELFYDAGSGILGWAGPEWYRTADGQPLTASMGFNLFYTDLLIGYEIWDDVVFHELMHTIGFGTMWDYMGLLSGGGTDNPTFTGDFATGVYEATSGITNSGGVPLESGFGPGTDDSHWDEDTFGNEVMTGFIDLPANDLPANYLSDMTVASLDDFGYETVWPNTVSPVQDLLLA